MIGYSGAADAGLRTLEENVSTRERPIWMGRGETMDPSPKRLLDGEYTEYAGNADSRTTTPAFSLCAAS